MGLNDFWQGKRVLITGHTGFKGCWLSVLLNRLGAEVYGYALEDEVQNNLFYQSNLKSDVVHVVGDVRDEDSFSRAIKRGQPDIVFHLAAQSLVRRSYAEPIYTWQTNVLGTCNLLNTLRKIDGKCAVVVVTTDKVYKNNESLNSFSENDRLGGVDPYSASKSSAELAVNSWRDSYFVESGIKIATARAGNVIGGGDWSEDRIIPDLVRAVISKRVLKVRNPNAVRPWQHVMESLSGYLTLARRLYQDKDAELQSAFNFGPESSNFKSVKELVEAALQLWPGNWECLSSDNALYESELLTLSSDKAKQLLSWHPVWGFQECVQETIEWYRLVHEGKDPKRLMMEQICRYMKL